MISKAHKCRLSFELITIPREITMSSVKPAINIVRMLAKKRFKTFILYEIAFETKQQAKDYYNQWKDALEGE